jgi:hypothetical protein
MNRSGCVPCPEWRRDGWNLGLGFNVALGIPHHAIALSPKAIQFFDPHIAHYFGLAGKPQRAIGGMGRKGSTGAIAPVGLRHLTFNLNSAGAASANSMTVNDRCATVVKINAMLEQNSAEVISDITFDGLPLGVDSWHSYSPISSVLLSAAGVAALIELLQGSDDL